MHLIAAAILCFVSTALGAPANSGLPDVTNSFIITLQPHVSKTRISAFLTDYTRSAKQMDNVEEAEGNSVKFQYSLALNGFAGKFTPSFIAALKARYGNDIAAIEPDGVVTTMGKQDNPDSWGLTRVSQRSLKLPGPYYFPDAGGDGVEVFVIDTGVQATHTDFGGRAAMVANYITDEPMEDMNGHGTHCSGTIGSLTYGVAKRVHVRGVKVLSGAGSGTWAGVISGVEFVMKAAKKGPKGGVKTVASMSLGGGKNDALNTAMNNMVKAGVVAIVAAGNNGGDACQISPASAELVMAVAASDNTDTLASFSNRGKCVKIAGPGVNIKSLWKGANGATNTISGTSMATPHVAGLAALLMSQKEYATPQDVYKALQALATKDKLKGIPADGTPNLLGYNGAGVAEDDGSVPAAA